MSNQEAPSSTFGRETPPTSLSILDKSHWDLAHSDDEVLEEVRDEAYSETGSQSASDCDNEVLEGVRDGEYSEIGSQSASDCDNDKDNFVADSEFDEWKQYDEEAELEVDVMGGERLIFLENMLNHEDDLDSNEMAETAIWDNRQY
jgi:hypothetical protein